MGHEHCLLLFVCKQSEGEWRCPAAKQCNSLNNKLILLIFLCYRGNAVFPVEN
uniref:Uncharacterized protein n=1 Tax=Lepeophtheirus salmonis TaxID=72036 RepID=A0A0K2V5R5_LEPSM